MTSKAVLAVALASSMQPCSGFTQIIPTRPATLLHSSRFDQEVNEIFQRYDTDGNGQIDKEEFREVVKKMKSSSRRREIISVAAATFGSLVSQSLWLC